MAQNTATTTSTRIFGNQGGHLVCEKHAGNYLSALLKENPQAASFPTPLGTWWDFTEEANAEGYGCEMC